MKPSEFLQMRTWLGFITISLLLISSTHAITKKSQSLSLADQFLAPQNAARKALGLPKLAWDAKVARYARWYAKQRRSDCALQHSNGPYGENIFWGSGSLWTPYQAVAAWLSERKWYNYQSNSCAGGQMCGHYTQIVWSTTTKVGCARVNCLGGKGVFITCNYDPPGNYIGEKPY